MKRALILLLFVLFIPPSYSGTKSTKTTKQQIQKYIQDLKYGIPDVRFRAAESLGKFGDKSA